MTTRYEYLQLLATRITDELVTTNVAGVAKEWDHIKRRDGNLLRVYMSAASALALGLALSLPHRRVISLDGDGSLLMGLSIFPAIAYTNPANLIVIAFDNEAYEAGANIPTFTAGPADLAEIARGSGIQNATTVREPAEFERAIDQAFKTGGPTVIVVKVPSGAAPIPFPSMDGIENKYRLIRYIEQTENIQIIKPAGIRIPVETKWKEGKPAQSG